MIKKLLIKTAVAASVASLMLMPVSSISANSTAENNFIAGNVQTSGGQLTINSITGTKTSGIADGTFNNGWQYVIDVTAPINETNLSMKFDNWIMSGNPSNIIPAAGNIRFYSSQSSNAFNQGSAIFINSANTYTGPMFLTGNLGGSPPGTRRIQIVVETRIPVGTAQGTYTDVFGIKTQ